MNTLPEPCRDCTYLPLLILWLARQELELTDKQLAKLEELMKRFAKPKEEAMK